MRWHAQRKYVIGAAVLAVVVIVVASVIHSRMRSSAAQSFAGQHPKTTVGIAVAARADIPITIDALGTATPLATAVVRPQVSGILTQVRFVEGQTVSQGDTLAVIDERPFQLALDQALGTLRRDEAQLELARAELARDQILLKQDSIAQQDVDAQRAMVHQLEGTVVNDRAAVGIARLNLSYCNITAPISGQAGLRTVDPGNIVSTTDTTGIVTITQVQPMDVAFTLPADQIVAVQRRVTSGAQLAVTVMDRTLKTTLAHGTFSTLDNQVDAQTGTVRAKARVDNAARLLFPGEFVNVRLLLDTLKGAVAVPSSAVHQGPQGDYVWIVSSDHTVHLRGVRRGPATESLISLESGVALGEQVVTEGSDRLTDGASVQAAGAPHPRPGISR